MSIGSLNPHTVGIIMKECARRAMLEIRKQRIIFTSEAKFTDYKKDEDLVTSADYAAQAIYVRALTENFPDAGIIAEEDFARKCTDPSGNDYFFTVDPLDGTKAYGRKQSHGVSTMISFVYNGEIVASTIGDVNAQEIYHSRPCSDHVHRIYDFEASERLVIDATRSLTTQYILLREPTETHEATGRRFADTTHDCRLFRGLEIMGGSIGTMFARLWKSEVGAILLPASPYMTAWDSCPVFGISKKMGFVLLELTEEGPRRFEYTPAEKTPAPHDILCVHKSRIQEILEWNPDFKGMITL